ncbi:MAG: hypothetical protein ABI847_21100, partial [Anaerolineales bacterium]
FSQLTQMELRPFIPLIFGGLLWLLSLLLQDLVVVQTRLFPLLAALVLLLAPTPFAYQGRQPRQQILAFFQRLPAQPAPIRMLGNSTTTFCAYLTANGMPCAAQEWDDGVSYRRLDDLMRQAKFQYLVVDPTMDANLTQPTGLAEVVAGRDRRWQLVATFNRYSIYRNMQPGN